VPWPLDSCSVSSLPVTDGGPNHRAHRSERRDVIDRQPEGCGKRLIR
jgi:hypothetical protein